MNLSYTFKPLGCLSLHVAETESDEPTLVMLHGVTRRWQTYAAVTASLSQRYRLMLVDFRGHGKSDRSSSGYRVVNYVEDICQLIERHISGPVFLYGHSLGAMTVAGVAERLGDRISAIVMEDPPFHTMGRRINTTPLLSYFTGVSRFAGDRREVSQIAADLARVEFSDPVNGQVFKVGDSRDAAQLRFAASCLQRLDPEVFDSITKSEWLEGYDVDEIVCGLKCPSLLLQAEYGAGGMLTDADATHVCRLNSNVARVQFPGIPHGIHWAATTQLLNVVVPFLESVR